MDLSITLAVLSFAANVVLALIVYSLKTTIRVAILEAVANISMTYATKGELEATEERLKESIALKHEMRAGFSRLGVGVRDV